MPVLSGHFFQCVVQLCLIICSCQNLKESINEIIVIIINQGSINAVSSIYHPPPPQPPILMRTDIKIITFAVTVTEVPETDTMISTIITAQKMFKSLFLKKQPPQLILTPLPQLTTTTEILSATTKNQKITASTLRTTITTMTKPP